MQSICSTLAAAGPDCALLLQSSRLVTKVRQVLPVLSPTGSLDVVTPPQLRGGRCYERLIVVGPSTWFPEFVLSAPRASEIHLVRYEWLRDQRRDEPAFAGSFEAPAHTNGWRRLPQLDDEAARPPDLPTIDPGEIAPRVEWAKTGVGAPNPSNDADDDDVDATLFILEDNSGVFLEDDDDALLTVIDLDKDQALTVQRIRRGEIERGTFILLRTEGGGDYILEVADRLMGPQAIAIRACQNDWKRRMRVAVRDNGAEETCRALKERGALRANEANLRSWTNNRSIRPQSQDDFNAMMQLIGFDGEAQEIWDKMGEVRRAHQTAGQRVRRLLLERVRACDTEELERMGRMDFELPGEDGGTLTAFRIVDIAPESTIVPSSRVGHPFELEAITWRE